MGAVMVFIVLLSFLIFSISLAQTEFYNPAPSWVKKGLVVVYSIEGGSATGTGTPKSSGIYGKGYLINVVLELENQIPYGLKIFLSSSGYSTFFDSKLGDLSLVSFYLNAKEINKAIQKKESPPNCQLNGKPGKIFMRCNQKGLSSKYIVSYDTKSGLIKDMVLSQTSVNGNITQIKANYIKHYHVNLPLVKDFPISAFESHTYTIYTFTPMGKMPSGKLNIRYIGKSGKILNYEEVGQGFPLPSKKVGLLLAGPHYIHPAWLLEKTLLNISEAEFEITRDGKGERGGILINYRWRGIDILQQEFDIKTGLLLYQYYPSLGGFALTIELQE